MPTINTSSDRLPSTPTTQNVKIGRFSLLYRPVALTSSSETPYRPYALTEPSLIVLEKLAGCSSLAGMHVNDADLLTVAKQAFAQKRSPRLVGIRSFNRLGELDDMDAVPAGDDGYTQEIVWFREVTGNWLTYSCMLYTVFFHYHPVHSELTPSSVLHGQTPSVASVSSILSSGTDQLSTPVTGNSSNGRAPLGASFTPASSATSNHRRPVVYPAEFGFDTLVTIVNAAEDSPRPSSSSSTRDVAREALFGRDLNDLNLSPPVQQLYEPQFKTLNELETRLDALLFRLQTAPSRRIHA
ncbi:hypothetical protein JCM5353_001714 [Sporobolomyces roseus]